MHKLVFGHGGIAMNRTQVLGCGAQTDTVERQRRGLAEPGVKVAVAMLHGPRRPRFGKRRFHLVDKDVGQQALFGDGQNWRR